MGQKIKLGVIELPPLVNACALDPECPKRGLAVEAAVTVCEFLRLDCVLDWHNSFEFGDVEENGTATGLVAAIQRGTYDTSLPMLTPTHRRFQALDFSHPYFYFETVLATRVPIENRQSIDWSVINVFQLTVWWSFAVLLAVCAVLATLFMHKCAFFSRANFFTNQSVLSSFIEWVMSFLWNASKPNFLLSFPIRVCYGAWLLAAVVLTSAYTGMLFEQKVIRLTNLPFTNLETFVQCLEQGRCRIIAHTQSISFLQQLTVPGTALATRVNKALKSHPVVLVPLAKIPEAILEEKEHFLVWHWPRLWLYHITQGNRDCNYYLVQSPFMDVDAFPVPKNSTLLKNLNKLSFPYTENRLNHIRDRYFPQTECGRRIDGRSGARLRFGSLLTAIYFYTMGTGFAIVAMGAELAIDKLTRRYRYAEYRISAPIDRHFWCTRSF